MKIKTNEPEVSDVVMLVLGVICFVILLTIASGLVFTLMFNSFFVPIFMPQTAPISWQMGVGLNIFIWMMGGAFHYKPTVKVS